MKMKNKKISIYTLEIIIFILSSMLFLIPVILLRNNPYLYLIAAILFLFIITLNYYIANILLALPIQDAAKKISHYNNNEFGFFISSNITKESKDLKLELDNLAKNYQDITTKLKEKIYENETYFNHYKMDMEKRKQLVAAISHEIKTPLAIIETTASAILDDIIPEDEIKAELQNIINEANKTNEMLKEIIKVYKTSTNLAELPLESLNLKDLLKEVLDELNGLILKYKQKVEILSNLDLNINVSRVEFKQALTNILINAITYSPSKSKITINLLDNPNYNALEIINYGIEIQKEDANKLFEPFYRSDKSRERKEDHGNGLGLFLVKETLEKHNLDYGITNVNNGVKFYIIFQK